MRRIQFKSAGAKNVRHDKRQAAPELWVTVAGVEFSTQDWSLGGVRLNGIPEGAEMDLQIQVRFTGERGDRTWSATATALYVWIDTQNRQSGLRFTNLPNASFDALESLVTGISR